ncbi:MAG TPA: hypothetical protein VMK12_20805 [Anaeromyxobacteraceae bacterium]|nr:hypothetical protein [Anaeromyxobacteraceae bacterium]
MTQTQTKTKTQQALIQARAAAQQLHGALSDAASSARGAVTADLEAVEQKTRELMETLKYSMSVQDEKARKHLKEALVNLEAAQKHAMKGAKSVGQVLQDSVRKTLAEARVTAQHISEALAEERSASAPKSKN